MSAPFDGIWDRTHFVSSGFADEVVASTAVCKLSYSLTSSSIEGGVSTRAMVLDKHVVSGATWSKP